MRYAPTKRDIASMVLLGSLGVCIFVMSLVLLYNKITSIRTSATDSKMLVGNVDNILEIKRDYNSKKEQIAILDSFFVHEGGEINFIEEVESLGKSADVAVKINSLDTGNTKSADNVRQNLKVRVAFEGSLANAINFLHLLETMPYALTIGDTEMNNTEGVWSGEIELSVVKFDN